MIAQAVLHHIQQGLSEALQREGRALQVVDLGFDSNRQHGVGVVSA
jgi:hypothetical protein